MAGMTLGGTTPFEKPQKKRFSPFGRSLLNPQDANAPGST